ncbi:MAG: hypothetical protein RSF13_03165 [Clostridiales bacterium]
MGKIKIAGKIIIKMEKNTAGWSGYGKILIIVIKQSKDIEKHKQAFCVVWYL